MLPFIFKQERNTPFMLVTLKAGPEYPIESPGYMVLPPFTDSGLCVARVAYLIKTNHPLSALELKRKIGPVSPDLDMQLQDIEYLVMDGTSRTIDRIRGVGKGYAGEGHRAAITIETYFDLFNVPLLRNILPSRMSTAKGGTLTLAFPNPQIPKYDLTHVQRAKKRAKDHYLALREGGLDQLSPDTSLDDVLTLADFRTSGHWVPRIKP